MKKMTILLACFIVAAVPVYAGDPGSSGGVFLKLARNPPKVCVLGAMRPGTHATESKGEAGMLGAPPRPPNGNHRAFPIPPRPRADQESPC